LFAAALRLQLEPAENCRGRHRGGEPAALLDLDGWVARSGSFLSLRGGAFAGQTPGFYLKEGRAYSGYPIALPLLLNLCTDQWCSWSGPRNGYRTDRAHGGGLEKLAASLSLPSRWRCSICWHAGSQAGNKWSCVGGICFCDRTWTVSSQALWQHGGGSWA